MTRTRRQPSLRGSVPRSIERALPASCPRVPTRTPSTAVNVHGWMRCHAGSGAWGGLLHEFDQLVVFAGLPDFVGVVGPGVDRVAVGDEGEQVRLLEVGGGVFVSSCSRDIRMP